MKFIDKDLASVQEARILLENADVAKNVFSHYTQKRLDEMLKDLHEKFKIYFGELAKLSVASTSYGKEEDEEKILNLLSSKMIEKYVGLDCKKDEDKDIIYIPVGIVVGLIGDTNPLITAISLTYSALKSGNALILATSHRSNKVINRYLEIIENILTEVGYPKDVLTNLKISTEAGIKELLKSLKTSMIVNVGAMNPNYNPQNIRYIYGSLGASPIFIDETAKIDKAVSEIITSRSFNNGLLPGVEQFLIVHENVEEEIREELIKNKAYIMTIEEEEKLKKKIFKNGIIEEEYIGKDAEFLAKLAGINVPSGIKVLVSEQKYISNQNYYSKELKMPILALYIEKDWLNACHRCIELLVEDEVGHTLSIYSNNIDVISEFVITKPVGRILINTSSAFGGMGLTSDIFPSAILGAMVQKKGMNSKNLSPRDMVYVRSIGRNEKELSSLLEDKKIDEEVNLEKLEKVLRGLIKDIRDNK